MTTLSDHLFHFTRVDHPLIPLSLCTTTLSVLATHVCLCFLQQNPTESAWEDPALEKLHVFCSESRSCHEWVPEVTLPAR